jgi:hypothetical protein
VGGAGSFVVEELSFVVGEAGSFVVEELGFVVGGVGRFVVGELGFVVGAELIKSKCLKSLFFALHPFVYA